LAANKPADPHRRTNLPAIATFQEKGFNRGLTDSPEKKISTVIIPLIFSPGIYRSFIIHI
jgi:hypothetical protein